MSEDSLVHNAENCPFKNKFLELEQEHNELKQTLHMSGVYGKSLLEETNILKDQIKDLQQCQEKTMQENHHLKMALEVSQKFHGSQVQEIESLKEVLQKLESDNQQLKTKDEGQHRKEVSYESQIMNLQDQEVANKEKYEQLIKDLELEMNQLKCAERTPMLINCNHEEEINQLQLQLDLNKQSYSKLEEDLVASQNQIHQLQVAENKLRQQLFETEKEVLSKEKELASTEKLMEEKRTELLETQALLEAERVSQTNPEKRGIEYKRNSIFSEVEDRRQQVERHLSKLTTLLDKEKRKNADLSNEIIKVKNQMAFLACGGANAEPSKSVEQMENMLRSSNAQNKDLLKRIEELEQKAQCQPHPTPQLEDSKKWMQAMLTQKQTENDKLRSEIRDHIRSYLCLQDQTMQLTKRLTETEKNMHRARSEVFRLKVKIEEMVTSSNENMPTPSPIYTIPPTKIVENLQFVFEKKEEAAIPPEKPLKERVVLQAQLEPNASILSSSSVIVQEESSSIKENDEITPELYCTNSTEEPKPSETVKSTVKRNVRMLEQVHVVYEDGDSTLETLADDKFTAGAKKPESEKKPVGKRVEIEDATKPNVQCAQQ